MSRQCRAAAGTEYSCLMGRHLAGCALLYPHEHGVVVRRQVLDMEMQPPLQVVGRCAVRCS